MFSTHSWIVCYVATSLFWVWVIWWGGAEWLEGTLTSAFLISWLAPTWTSGGIRVFAQLSLLVGTIAFVVGFFVPGVRCWSSTCW